jgi:DNA-binding transcriptional ArsR family regulator
MSEQALLDQLKALAHPLRYRIIECLLGGECNVGEIESVAGIGQPTLSQQLAVLRKAGLVDTRKEAKLVYYRLDRDLFARLATSLGRFAATDGAAASGVLPPDPNAANFARLI